MGGCETVNILELIPQRRPFVMIDRMTYFDPMVISTSLRIAPDNIFVEGGAFTEAGIIESVAQTCAARMGYLNMLAAQKAATGEKAKIKLGFIGSIKNLTIERLPNVGDEINITVKVKNEIGAVILVEATVVNGEQNIATGMMTISLTDIDSEE